MASRGDTQSLRLIEFADSTTSEISVGNLTLSANSGSLYFNGTQVNTGTNNFAVMSTDLIVPYNNSSSVTIGSNLVLRQSTTTNYQAGQGFQYLSDGRLFFEGVEFGGRTNLLPVVTSNIVTSQSEYLRINANVSILNSVNVTTANVFLRSNVVFSMSDPEIQFDSGALTIRPLTTAGVLKIYGSSNKANVWLVSNDSTNGSGTDVANFSFVSTGDNTTSTNKHAIAKISVNQTEALSASSGGGILSLTTRDPTKAATTDQGDSDRQLTMLSCNTSTSGNIITLGPGGDLDNVYVGIGLVRPTNKFQVYSGGKTFFAVDTVGSKISIGSSTALDFDGPITISGQSADRLMIGTTGAGQYATSVGVNAGAAGQGALALGYEAGKTGQGIFATSIGFQAGYVNQSINATAIGTQSGFLNQGSFATAIGPASGLLTQGSYALAIGDSSGSQLQGAYSIAIGASSGQASQGSTSVAIGFQAGQSTQGSQSLAMGYQAGQTSQGVNSTAIGYQAGKTSQGSSAMAFGTLAGETSQGADSMALGTSAGQTSQGVRSVAIGSEAGKTSQSSDSTAIGYFAGQVSQGSSSIAIGTSAGQSTQGSQSLALGFQAGQTSQGSSSISVGQLAGNYFQGQGTVAIGRAAGKNNQGSFSIAIGLGAAVNAQSVSAVAIGYLAGSNVQGSGSVAIGTNAGFASQSSQSVAIGVSAGQSLQSYLALALGYQAGQFNQSPETIAIGSSAGNSNQGSQAIAIGSSAGFSNQDVGSIAMGYNAARVGQGAFSIAIGYNTGSTNQIPDKTIFLNATGGSFVPYVSSSFNVRPVRISTDTASGNVLSYNYGTGEIYQQGLIFTGSSGVGISNGAPGDHLLAIGTRTYFEESTASNAIVTVGNISAIDYHGSATFLSNVAGVSGAGTHGSGSTVPVVNVDSLGRIVSVSNTAITYGGTLQQVVDSGNTVSNTMRFITSSVAFVSNGAAGISNSNPQTSYTLSVGEKTAFSETLSNAIITTGNIAANYIYSNAWFSTWTTRIPSGTYGTSTLVPQLQFDSSGRIINITEIGVIANVSLGQALAVGNTTTRAISFQGATAIMTNPGSNVGIGNTNPLNLLSIGANTYFTELGSNTLVTRGNVSANVGYFTSIITSSNVGIGNTLPSNLLCVGTRTRFNEAGSNIGMITDGNVTAIDYYGSARFLSNVAGATTAATYGSGTAMPQIVVDASGRITSIVSTQVSATLNQVAGFGNTTSNTIQFTNTDYSLITSSNVGIGNAYPSNLLCIGTKTRFNDLGSNTGMVTDGNVTAVNYYGSARFVTNLTDASNASYGNGFWFPQLTVSPTGRIVAIQNTQVRVTLSDVTNFGNSTSNTVQFTNSGNSLITSGRVGIGNANPSNLLSIGLMTRFNDSGSNTGMVTDGNVTANYYYGSAVFLSNVAGASLSGVYGSGVDMPRITVDASGRITNITSTAVSTTLDQVVGYGGTTAKVINLSNTGGISLVTTGNVGIGNTNPSNLLCVGTRTRFNESGSNVGMITDGNVTAVDYYGSARFLSNVAGATTAATYGSGTAMPQIVVDASGRITSIVSTQVSATLNQVAGFGNATSNTIQFTNSINSLVTSGNVGIGNANPSNLLSIGLMTRFNDSGSNTGMITNGNVTATNYYGSARFLSNVAGATTAATYGSGTAMPQIVVDASGRITSIVSTQVSATLDQVAGFGNTTSNTIQFTNSGNSLITSGNVGIGNANPSNLLCIGTKTRFNDSGSNTGMITEGNVTAVRYYGSAQFLSNVAGVTATGSYGSTTTIPTVTVDSFGRITTISDNQLSLTLSQVANFGNSTSNTVLFTNTGNSFVAYGNVAIGNAFGTSNTLTVGSNLWVRDTGSNVLFVNGNIFTTSLKTSGNVGIGNVVPSNLLCIGSSTYFTDNAASNVMVTIGNVSANYYYGNAWNARWTTRATPATYGSGTTVPQIIIDSDGRVSSITSVPLGEGSVSLDQALRANNVTANVIVVSNTGTCIFTTGNVFANNFRITSNSIQLGLEAGTVGQNGSSVSIGTRAGQSGQYSNAVAIGLQAGQFNQEIGAISIGEFAGQLFQNSSGIAIGSEAGRSGQFDYAIAIGELAGASAQGSAAVAIGQQTGQVRQSNLAVAIGYYAAQAGQGSYGISIGSSAGSTSQGVSAISIGNNAGNSLQTANAVAIGSYAGQSGQATLAVAMGNLAGQLSQNTTAVAIGQQCGQLQQGVGSVALGSAAGTSAQQSYAVAIGPSAGRSYQNAYSVAIGANAGQDFQDGASIAIGQSAGQFSQNTLSIAIGYTAGVSFQGSYAIGVGWQAGAILQNTHAVSIGYQAGANRQGSYSVALGDQAGETIQGDYSIAIGEAAGQTSQGASAVAIGDAAGLSLQGEHNVAIGESAGRASQNIYSVAIGYFSGASGQGYAGISIGGQAGRFGQSSWGVAIGDVAGQSFQGKSAVAISDSAGQLSQNAYGIAIGSSAGQSYQNSFAVAIGLNAGQSRQRQSAIAIGPNAGVSSQGSYAIAIGNFAGSTNQGSSAVAVGDVSGGTQSAEAVAIGVNSGGNQGVAAIAIGSSAGFVQSSYAIGIGVRAGRYQFSNAIAIGIDSGATPGQGSQGVDAIAIGTLAGYGSSIQQNTAAVAIGLLAGYDFQNTHAISIGTRAGQFSQNAFSVAIGYLAGASGQARNSVAIGETAGRSNQGSYSICLGPGAGASGCGVSSIIINAGSGSLSNTTASALYIDPIRSGASSTGNLTGYNPTSKELFYTGISQNSAGDLVAPEIWGPIAGANTIACSTLTATSYVAGNYFGGLVVASTATTYTINSANLASVYLFTPASTATITLANLPSTGDGVVIHIRCTNSAEFRLAPASGVSLVQTNNNIISFPSYEGYPSARTAMLTFQDSTTSWYVLNYI